MTASGPILHGRLALMGATNAMAAYRLYAGRIPATSMQLLAYMALVSKDDDTKPWYGQGYGMLAACALGRPGPITDADLRAVERAMKPLLAIRAVTTERRAAARRDGPRTARYRLHLVTIPAESIDTPPVDNPPVDHSGNGQRPTETVEDDPRKTVRRPTKSGGDDPRKPGDRGTTRNQEERGEEDHKTSQGDSLPSTGTPTEHEPEISDDESGTAPPAADPDVCPGCGVLLDPGRICGTRLCVHFGERLATVHPIAA